ncbi:hypothetical protein BJ085DRAFT_35530 [Dimargaris cristalligena]|uniref:Uncharacterized protein n=1 Tax=Dimargaris cristalligena TaxID=215637 RepID=A0A4P9ZR76_9FUNG|nr:hypothetical protein BJ085DRAFT_35530 [Dimargaris cristalligena]|eukprot:RKP35845.1 hypothetical protein BJ085DRAFT_35530 [Dimargaris cristalligena]
MPQETPDFLTRWKCISEQAVHHAQLAQTTDRLFDSCRKRCEDQSRTWQGARDELSNLHVLASHSKEVARKIEKLSAMIVQLESQYDRIAGQRRQSELDSWIAQQKSSHLAWQEALRETYSSKRNKHQHQLDQLTAERQLRLRERLETDFREQMKAYRGHDYSYYREPAPQPSSIKTSMEQLTLRHGEDADQALDAFLESEDDTDDHGQLGHSLVPNRNSMSPVSPKDKEPNIGHYGNRNRGDSDSGSEGRPEILAEEDWSE